MCIHDYHTVGAWQSLVGFHCMENWEFGMTWWVNYDNFHLWVNYLFKLRITHQCLCDRVGRPLIPLKTCRLHRLSPPPMASAHHLSTHLIIIIIMTQANFLPSSRLLYHFYLTLFYFQFRTTQLQTWQPAHRGGEHVGREREEQKSDGLWAAITGMEWKKTTPK